MTVNEFAQNVDDAPEEARGGRSTTTQSELDDAWERLLRTARECQIRTEDWELREPSYKLDHYRLQMHRGPHGPEVRAIGRGRTQAHTTLKALEAVLRHTREWRSFHDYHELADKSQAEKKREVGR